MTVPRRKKPMALKEVDYQTKIKDSVRQDGGWSNKWGAQYLIGVPDLVLGHSSFGTYFMEVKLQNCVGRKDTSFKLLKDTMPTAIQERTMTEMWEKGMQVCVGQVLQFGRTVKDAVLIISPINEVNETWPPSNFSSGPLAWVSGRGWPVVAALAVARPRGMGARVQ